MRLRFWMVLIPLSLLALPAMGQINGNTLDLSAGSAPNGTVATVTLGLANEDATGGIQADILFDASVAAFSGMTVTGRGVGMTAEGRVVESGRLRVVMYFGGSGSLPSETGAIAELTFIMQGAVDEQSVLSIEDIVLSDPDGGTLSASGTPGSLTVLPAESIPVLTLAALKNPGHTSIIMIMVTITGGSGDAPTVSANGAHLTMTFLGGGIFKAQYRVLPGQSTLTITAIDTNSFGTGNTQVTLALP